MRILVTGTNGQVGRELVPASMDSGFAPVALPREDLDITRPDAVEAALDAASPALVANCAAYTAVDRAETEPEAAFAVNRDGPAHLARACADRRIPLVHISTDYVFDGAKKEAYVEGDPVRPVNRYGESKAAGEAAVRERLERHVILRTAWVFSAHGGNFVKTMLRLGKERDTIGVVDDQSGCPTSAASIARAIAVLAERYRGQGELPWGTYHYCDRPVVTWYGFARSIFDMAREASMTLRLKELHAITTAQYPTPARRAANSVLDCSRFETTFGLTVDDWRHGLREVIRRLA